MTDKLLYRAQRLAERPYHIEIKCEPGELPPEVPKYTAYVKEIPYCVAQGFTEEEARQEMDSVLVDYILSLLDRNLPVPKPEIEYNGNESDYGVYWLGEDCFVHAHKSFFEQRGSPSNSLRAFVYAHSA
ncbi:MAG: type II toxin-antitoxin system HicB family antitoxin [Chloroflexi bacterium]|nr:type II toxin-antitoxin system HicB family antitoxin [Chloroflexota bacterium]